MAGIERYIVLLSGILAGVFSDAGPAVDETPGGASEWGLRPVEGCAVSVNPPSFVWRPQKGAGEYELQCARDRGFRQVVYHADSILYNVHRPSELFPEGKCFWRFRFRIGEDTVSEWSSIRSFTLGQAAAACALPPKEELLSRIPSEHPRLFVRPEWIPGLSDRISTDLEDACKGLEEYCSRALDAPPSTVEPAKYPSDMKRGSDPWRKLWWGNRKKTLRAFDAASALGLAYALTNRLEYGEAGRKILLECAQWDPKGSTGYRYNDEAGMPYCYGFSRSYTFLHSLLSEKERELCRNVMRIRGKEMYKHLCPKHLWRPYSSHSNRAWHFLGEAGIAFLGEIPEAAEWVWFAANVYGNVYPAWCDSDGGWHEGINYWRSYIRRFTWWADVMKAAFGINVYTQKPYFSRIGYYPLYLQPPGTVGGGFGDLTARCRSSDNLELMSIFASAAGNPHWQWYVDAQGGMKQQAGFVGFLRGAVPPVDARPPDDLPTSRCFQGTGQAVLNSTLLKAEDNVEFIFKSSPFGTQSHGYESQNSFLLYAFGERLFIRTGRRDSYGSKHHRNWMWQTKSTNCITVNGGGQQPHSSRAVGEITCFAISPRFDYVAGEAGRAYGDKLKTFTRRVLFAKPEAIIIYDILQADSPAVFEWLLHAPVEMSIDGQNDIRVENRGASCRAGFLWPEGLSISQTDRFDPPPRPRIKLTEYHLTAQAADSSEKQEFVTVLQPYRTGDEEPVGMPRLESGEASAFVVAVPVSDGVIRVVLRRHGDAEIELAGFRTRADAAAYVIDGETGQVKSVFAAGGKGIGIRPE